MKLNSKTIISLTIALAPCLTGVKAQSTQYTLDVKTTATNSKLFILQPIDDNVKLDSVLSSNGTFHLTGEVNAPQKASLYLVPKEQLSNKTSFRKGFQLYLEPGNILIRSNNKTLENCTLSGTPLNNDLYAFNEVKRPFIEKMEQLDIDYDKAREKKEYIKLETIQTNYNDLKSKLNQAEMDFFVSHLNSLVSLNWLSSSYNMARKKSKVTALYNQMGDGIKQSEAGKKFKTKLDNTQAVEIGEIAPDFSAKTPNGEDVSLNSFRGKYVLIDFWASWCGPCRKENPNVVVAYNTFKDKNFTILGVSLDNTKDAWEKAIEKDSLVWTQISDLKGWKSTAAALYSVRGIPSNFLIDPQGRILAFNLRGEELQKKLKEILP